MSEKLQQKLDQETFNPLVTVFLLILLRVSGLFDGFGDSEPKNDKILSSDQVKITLDDGQEFSAMDQALDDEWDEYRERMRRRDEALRRFVQSDYRGSCHGEWRVGNANDCERVPTPEPNIPTVHLDLGALGAIDLPVPEGAAHGVIDTQKMTLQWTRYDCSVLPAIDLRQHIEQQLWGIPVGNYGIDGYCTPSRRPMTSRDSHDRLVYGGWREGWLNGPVREGLNFDANGQPFMAVIDPRGETGEQGEGPTLDS